MSQRMSSQELLAQVKGEVNEMSMEELKEKLDRNADLVLIDVREQDEVDQGVIVGATHIPRGFLELRIENTEERPEPGNRAVLRGRQSLGAGGAVAGSHGLHQRHLHAGRIYGMERRRFSHGPGART